MVVIFTYLWKPVLVVVVFYIAEGMPFLITDKRENLLEKNISRLFIIKEDQKKYYEYLENNFLNIIADTRISTDEKTNIVHSAATNLIKDLFDNPRTGNIKRTKTFAYNMVDYILKEGAPAQNLLKILEHEYYTYTHSVNVAAVGTLFAQSTWFRRGRIKEFLFRHTLT